MKIDRKAVEYIANLARLALTEDEKEEFTAQLDKILAYIDKLSELDTKGVEPTTHAVRLKNVFRQDKAGPSLSGEEALSNAPAKDRGHFKVPRIIE
ncbi:Asp-tRNA(Asn)/Glu-tRNA(Gln) amidotransferase GatCAB subunit C [Candidatus Desantisbacteria bacterium CG_4_10_14_0_8_um_filter_48_22]|uniref:Aspartyl/glutamyl-tRNA(Asn/Gln) amidotransferase subunit C n=1 Tax=Candidatus Desantisbacteria bacterium CG_4_10_14_0_8_um_filter_48_22 TaxID=1974543 RepID=A0A2M7SDH0_9BACT|nr:MAG: asparaginyl/glutamyl-tRNA amidotransferase subunit C [Candidatus Desantisbacteria bacterium CG1_02_49_89]PIV54293.1 MAG: Asp-tRNA(Asn)/Glu-tRNA(Gln) amidotransferase GatCAB subunit C [Candidatus Desantisbacteria bacterium CG02_land_8_20_14_3_00_49_13]PIZ17562.1 MAG: Asp-tRNA(Asn)/Glu-tRNA(Gln) amidotransferase GatCAB subunit C [Candidatus Desantisbacteria bacterium CG_4_10_14_0_8_um_filter_48_22]PJB28747.1 MAG: Asp-tRNA(Asn)/Glu-tRNA(Gln) amidotransferase GatCAB subunit C [Candidatus Des